MSTLLIGQTGGPTAVINATLAGLIAEAQQQSTITAVWGMRHGLEGLLGEQFVDLSSLTAAQLELLAQTPAAALGSSRRKIAPEDYPQILDLCRKHDVRYLALIGGNGTMTVCQQLAAQAAAADMEFSVIGVPKTIDNDLAVTDHCPGYGSAARFLALAARDTGRDLAAMTTFDDVLILEALGRHTGWLAAASALGKSEPDDAPHLIYVPEVAFDETQFLDDAHRIHSRLGHVFIVVGEGIRYADGTFVGQQGAPRDTMGRVLYSAAQGASTYLANLLRERYGWQTRPLRPSLVGRDFSACVSATDRAEAYQVGQAAARHLADGHSGVMITLERPTDQPYTTQPGMVSLARVAGVEKLLPLCYMDDAGTMVTPAFYDYAQPLIGDPLPPILRL
ncbi:MAG: diphosphate--fructose-6-phosphate 1-phosphotransferase [Anaerolineae bacterium]|nr:diphosphate--fructose-6-phosphate 1-phosphotransferase [Anaerolineae bacterium]